jgi:hyperosmotically inducible periplasmic protein
MPRIRVRPTTPLALLLPVLLVWSASACRRTDEGFRVEGERAAEGAREAGEALQAAGQQVGEAAQELERRAQPLVEDASLTARVKAKLAADPEVRAYTIDVDTLEQVVTLSGRVESAAIRAEAEKLTRGTSGVRGVQNNLLVGNEPAPTSPDTAATPAPPVPPA